MAKPREITIEFMDLLFKLVSTVDEHGITIDEMTEIITLSVASGHDKIELVLAMINVALVDVPNVESLDNG